MKKILIHLLLLANLTTGLSFALDSHPEAVMDHGSTAVNLLANTDHDRPDGDLHHNDHCAHAAAHLIGLIFSQSTPFVPSRNNDFVLFLPASASLYIAPLLRPPIA